MFIGLSIGRHGLTQQKIKADLRGILLQENKSLSISKARRGALSPRPESR